MFVQSYHHNHPSVPRRPNMKASCAHVALAAILATCRAAVAFLSPTAPLTRSRGNPAILAKSELDKKSLLRRPSVGAAAGRAVSARGGVRLAAALEDCKSCMEKELLAEERASGKRMGAGGGEGRRPAFEEVTTPARS